MAKKVCVIPTPIIVPLPVDRSWDVRAEVPEGKQPVIRLLSIVDAAGTEIEYELGWESQVANTSNVVGQSRFPIYAGETSPTIAPNAFTTAGLDAQVLAAPRDLDEDWMKFYVRASGPASGGLIFWVGWQDFEGDDFVRR